MAASNRNGFNIKNHSNTVELSIETMTYKKPGKLKGDIEKILAELTKATPNCNTLTLALYLDNIDYEDQLALQLALLEFIGTHLKNTQTLNVLNLEGWDIKLTGKEKSSNLTQKKVSDHKNKVLRELGIALAKNKSVSSLSLADGGFTKDQFNTFFVRLDEMKTEPNKKLSLKSLNIAGHGIASETHIKEAREKAEERNMELKWLKPKNPQLAPAVPTLRSEANDHPSQSEEAKQPHAPYPQWVPNGHDAHDSDRPKRDWRTYLKRMFGFALYFGATSLIGGMGAFFISANFANYFLAGTAITLLGVSLSALGIGLIIAGAIIVGGLLAGAAYGLYQAEKEYQLQVIVYNVITQGLKLDDLKLSTAALTEAFIKAFDECKNKIMASSLTTTVGNPFQREEFIIMNSPSLAAGQLKFMTLPPTTPMTSQLAAGLTEKKDDVIQMDNPNQPPSLGA